ncbi:hypothetical protein [Variovorax sp. J31P207]|uniref:hypothetical protein n=1 Tax=Variovorax sp. J31P207 TaxID=3053510 RepID=UPI0025757CD8|nr:hypothetical protein [Variovorax sp. J31P207]MDM0070664.1 hypothetical protein [Variovorax sp. J31P207]
MGELAAGECTSLADDEATDEQTLFLPGLAHERIEAADPMLVTAIQRTRSAIKLYIYG